MQTKRLIIDFIVGFAPVLVIVVPWMVIAHLLDPPYDALGGVVIMVLAALLAPWSPWSVLPRARERRFRARGHSHASR